MIPAVSDRAWPIVRTVWLLLFLAAIVIEYFGLVGSYERASARPFAHVGLGWRLVDGEVTLRAPSTDQARAAGLRDGQTLIAVNGVRVGNRAADMRLADRLLQGQEGSAVVLTTRDPQGRVADHRLTRSEAHADALFEGSGITNRGGLIIQLIYWAVPDVLLLLVSFILMRGRRREGVGVLFAYCFVLGVLGGSTTGFLYSTHWQVLLRDLFNALAAAMLGAALVAFPDGHVTGRFRKSVLLLAVVAAAGQLTVSQASRPSVLAIGFVFGLILPVLALYCAPARPSRALNASNCALPCSAFRSVW